MWSTKYKRCTKKRRCHRCSAGGHKVFAEVVKMQRIEGIEEEDLRNYMYENCGNQFLVRKKEKFEELMQKQNGRGSFA
ncbi:unnamed protein product [marine sediment metagenome]|uniref:Uncharacterized protein n=1 Tax=marine sediment metagenome TaxID=412755 RepID=X1DUX5_9ZZZZ